MFHQEQEDYGTAKGFRGGRPGLPNVMTPCARILVGREFVLNWDRGSEAGSSSWHPVRNRYKAWLRTKEARSILKPFQVDTKLV